MLAEMRDKLRAVFSTRQRYYQQTFKGPVAKEVLRDLSRFCRANVSTFHENDRAHCLAEGRREVWLRIANHLHLTPDELYRLTVGED